MRNYLILKRSTLAYTLVAFSLASCASVISIEEFGIFYIPFTGILINVYATDIERYDNATGWDSYSNALPFTKKDEISAKYAWGLIMFGYSCLHVTLPYIIQYIVSMFSEEISFSPDSIYRAITVVCIAAFINGVGYIFNVLYGRKHMMIVQLLILFLLCYPGYLICVRGWLNIDLTAMLITLLCTLAIYGICYTIPFKVLKKRRAL